MFIKRQSSLPYTRKSFIRLIWVQSDPGFFACLSPRQGRLGTGGCYKPKRQSQRPLTQKNIKISRTTKQII